MTDTVRIVLIAAVLSASALAVLAWRLTRLDPGQAERLIGELRLAQMGAVLLALTGGVWLGLGIAHEHEVFASLDLSLGIVYAMLAGVVLLLEPRQALLVLAIAFAAHALIDIGHRPGGLSDTIAPRWFIVGCALYDVCLGAICFLGRRR